MRITDADNGGELAIVAPGSNYTGGVGTTGAYDLPLFTNNIDRVIIKSDGNVGIGTTSPQAKLDIASSSSGDKLLRFNMPRAWSFVQHANNAGTTLRLQAEINDKRFEIVSADGSNRAAIFKTDNLESTVSFAADGGRVGIGTTSPNERLHVLNNADDAIVKIESPGSSYEARMEVHKFGSFSAGVGYYPGNANLRLRTNTNNAIVFEPNGTEAMRVNQNGNVGIGTTSPADELHVEGSIRMVDGNQAAGYIPVSDANGTMTWTDPTTISTADDGDWSTSGNDIYNANTGNVGIGTSTPAEVLEVVGRVQATNPGTSPNGSNIILGSPANDVGLTMNRGNGSGSSQQRWDIKIDNDNSLKFRSQNSDDYMTLNNTGNLGIGTTAPGQKLHVAGRALVSSNGSATSGIELIPMTSTFNSGGRMFFREDNASDVFGFSLGYSGLNAPNGILNWPSNSFNISRHNGNATGEIVLSVSRGTGNVGIGTTGASEKLEVAGKIRMVDGNQAAGYIPVSDANGTMTWTDPTTIAAADDGDWSVSGTDIYNANTGNVGVGTTAPEERLHVLNNAEDAIVKIESPGSGYEARMEVHKFGSYSAGVGYYPGNANLRLRTNTNNAIVFEPNGTEAMRVNQNGNVGVGTTAPTENLTITGANNATVPSLGIRSGNNATTFNDGAQIAFGYSGGNTYQHFIHTRHNGGGAENNAIDFYVSDATANNTLTSGSTHVMSLNGGNVGVGVTSPEDKLHVDGAIRMVDGNQAAGYIPVSDANGTMTWTDPTTITTSADGDWTVDGNDIYPAVSGNVGIGTTTPAAELDLNGELRISRLQSHGFTTGSNIIKVLGTTDSDQWIQFRRGGAPPRGEAGVIFSMFNNDHFFVNNVEDALAFSRSTENSASPDFANSNELMRLAANGSLGIGTASPSDKLHVEGAIRMVDGNQAAGYIPVSDANGTMTWTDPTTISDGDWTVNGTDISNANTGNVGIGTNSPQAKLDITSTTPGDKLLRFDMPRAWSFVQHSNNAGTTLRLQTEVNGKRFEIVSEDGSNRAAIFTADNSSSTVSFVADGGNLGVGTDAPVSKFHVEDNFTSNTSFVATIENTANGGYANGLKIQAGQNSQTVNNRFITFARPDGSEIGAVRQITSNSVDYNTTSDLRLKTNIAPTTKGLNDLMQIEVKDYLYKDDPAKPQTGFIAQQVYEHYPNAVTPGGDDVKTDPWMMDYGKMSPLLVKAIQDLKTEKDELQAQVEQLLKRVEQLENK